MILIGGTEYAGENKKSVFTLLNYLLPEKDIMPMHCSANHATGNRANERALRGVTSDSAVVRPVCRANDRPDDCAPKAVHSSIERRAAPAIAR